MTLLSDPPEQVCVLKNIRWETYQALLADLGDRRRQRIAYNKGRLEIMSPSIDHERIKKVLARLIEAFTVERRIGIRGAGSTTLQDQFKLLGVEPDECYYVQNEAAIRGKKKLDLKRDPPPDLVIEVDVFSKSLDRLEIYAGLGVKEVWRHDGKQLYVYHLSPDGDYRTARMSVVFPDMPIDELERRVADRETVNDTELATTFQDWVRRNIGK